TQERHHRVFYGHGPPVLVVAFSPDGRRLASGTGVGGVVMGRPDDKPHEVKIWDARTGRELLALSARAGWVYGLGFSGGEAPGRRPLEEDAADRSPRSNRDGLGREHGTGDPYPESPPLYHEARAQPGRQSSGLYRPRGYEGVRGVHRARTVCTRRNGRPG